MTTDLDYMNEAQKVRYTQLVAQWQQYKSLNVDDYARIEMLACIMEEMRGLQKFVNRNGTTYEVVATSGDVQTRPRPEYQQLVDLRARMGVIMNALKKNAALPEDELSEFLGA
jgi:hypothetical protein